MGSGTTVGAPMMGKLLEFRVQVGDQVNEGDILAIVEAMKMHVEVYSPQAGVVKELYGTLGEVVKAEETLVLLG